MAFGDLTDLATAKDAANITTSNPTTDGVLATLITAISSYVPQVINRNILADNYIETYEGNGKDSILLRQRPVIQVNSIVWQGQTLTKQADPFSSNGVGIWNDDRAARLIGYYFPLGMPVRIVYSAGYVTVPPDVSLAVAELVAEAYNRRTHIGETSRSQNGQVTTSFDGKAMHNAIADKLKNYRHGAPC